MLLYLCPHTTIFVSLYDYICVLVLLYIYGAGRVGVTAR
jgi:hypothetical protein